MKLNRKLGAALLVVCMVLSTLLPASAATLNATYSEANYYTIATAAYSRMLMFQNGVVVAANQNKQYGLIDATGKEVVPFQYAGMWSLGGNLYKIQDANGLQGIVDATGKVVRAPADVRIDCRNKTVRITDSDWNSTYYTLTMAPSTEDAYRDYTAPTVPLPALSAYADYWETEGGYYIVYDDEYNQGLLDAKGNVVFAPKEYAYTIVLTDSAGKIVFLVDRTGDTGAYQSALMDTGKNFLVPFGTYDRIQHDYRGGDIMWVQKGEQMGVIDYSGKVLVPLGNYQDIGGKNAQGYIAAVSYDGDPWNGMTNLSSKLFKDGAEVKSYPGQFIATEVYYRDLVFSPDGQKYGVMKVDGTQLIPAQYNIIDGNPETMDLIVTTSGQDYNYTYGLYTVDGKHVFDDKYTSLGYLADSKYKLYDGAHYGVMSSATGQTVIPFNYVDLRVHTLSFIELYDGAKYSIVDLNNNVVVPPSAEPINLFDSSDELWYSLPRADWYKEDYDGYTADVLPFVMKTDSGWATVYADYNTGKTYGELPRAASNINADGQFVYIGDNGLMGFGQTDPASWASGVPSGGTAPAVPMAYASATNISVDGKAVKFDAYALKDAQGNQTNYLKLRDVASILNGTAAQFQVGWDGSINITTGTAYTPNGSEMSTPFSGDRAYEVSAAATKVNGAVVQLEAITLKDDAGNGYTYYKLRDLGQALGFNVTWDQTAQTIIVESGKPYTG